MTLSKVLVLLLCLMFCFVLLAACGQQAAEEQIGTQQITEPTQSLTEAADVWDEGELPAVTVPQQTQPTTETVGETELTEGTRPAEGIKPTEPNKETNPSTPSQETHPPEASEPSHSTQPTESEPSEPTQPDTTGPEATELTEPPRLDEDELPPIPVF